MVAPIITFVFAGIIGFLAWKTSTIEAYLPDDTTAAVAEAPAAGEPAEAEASDEEAAEEPAPAEDPAEEPADEFEEMVEPPSDDDFDAPADDDFDF